MSTCVVYFTFALTAKALSRTDNMTHLDINNGSNNRGNSSSSLSSNGGSAEGTVSACYLMKK